MRKSAVIAALLSASLTLPAPAENTGLRRLTLRSDTLGWEAVGRVDIGNSGYCTGVLVRPDVVLTAGHCLFEKESGARRDPTQITFNAGMRDGEAVATRNVQRAVVHPDYNIESSENFHRIRNDVALLQLSQPISAALAAPFTIQPISNLGREVSVVSYAKGRSEALSWQKECGVLGRQEGLIAFSCDVYFGSSGAPVFDRSGGRARIVSIISSGRRDDDGSVSFGMELSNLVPELIAALRSGRGVFPTARLTAKRLQVGGNARTNGAKFLRP